MLRYSFWTLLAMNAEGQGGMMGGQGAGAGAGGAGEGQGQGQGQGQQGATDPAGGAGGGQGQGQGQQGQHTGDGQQQASWRETIPTGIDDPKLAETLTNYASRFNAEPEFKKSIASLISAQGQMIRIPDASKPDEMHKLFTKLGKPEKVDDYKFEHEKGRPELTDSEKQTRGTFAQLAHRIHLTQSQVAELVKWNDQQFMAQVAGFKEAEQMYYRQSEAQLKKLWPGQDYDANIQHANRAWRHFGGSKAQDLGNIRLENGGKLSDVPELVDMFARIGRYLGEDQGAVLPANTSDGTTIRQQIDQITQEAISKGKLTSDPEYHARLQPLYERLHGTKSRNGAGFGTRS